MKKKVVFCTILEQMFKCVVTDPSTQMTMTQQRLMCAIKNSRLPPNGCCFLNNTGYEIFFRINISQSLTTISGLDGTDLWLGLPGHQTSYQWTSSYEATLKPWFIRCMLILKRILLPVLLRQQQPSGSTLTFLNTHVGLCCVVVSCVLRSVAIYLNICSKLVQTTTFFFASFPTLVTHTSMVHGTTWIHFWHVVLENKSLFWSLLSPHEVGEWSFSALCVCVCVCVCIQGVSRL